MHQRSPDNHGLLVSRAIAIPTPPRVFSLLVGGRSTAGGAVGGLVAPDAYVSVMVYPRSGPDVAPAGTRRR